MKLQIVFEGQTVADIHTEMVAYLERIGYRLNPPTPTGPTPLPLNKPVAQTEAGQALPPAGLPFPPPSGAPVCPDHGSTLRLKPAGTNRQGAPYAAGWRCPETGCRTFVAPHGEPRR